MPTNRPLLRNDFDPVISAFWPPIRRHFDDLIAQHTSQHRDEPAHGRPKPPRDKVGRTDNHDDRRSTRGDARPQGGAESVVAGH